MRSSVVLIPLASSYAIAFNFFSSIVLLIIVTFLVGYHNEQLHKSYLQPPPVRQYNHPVDYFLVNLIRIDTIRYN